MEYDTRSPLDDTPNPRAERLVARRPKKDKILSIRLDSQSRRQLDIMAAANHLGPSTLAHLIIIRELSRRIKSEIRLSDAQKAEEAMTQGRPQWCGHPDCLFCRRALDNPYCGLCSGKLPEPHPHEGDFNLYRVCIRTDNEVFQLALNDADIGWFRWIFDGLK